ncbi:type II toxin-antitoxin system VapC family toxin [Tessaracoccus flavus]|uniref:Ribonuclease VapC n=1 Tax=Tessaracoccus flavus TaxID=1610493 RepID=A0A1Q2CCQ3_9ACTN|nr:VapC toxin family PIN domain ribonuclease [Tessaracoccus flavus]AQP43903.1 VapC toxin family PIN domain ribonuclease [Tessaracoccus flavus]SDY28107.1 hypothetical protein SAMN05428934_101196 [Tessaracoccus flavus]
MIALDAPLLVYAHRADSPHHERALATLTTLAAEPVPFAVPWACVNEFLSTVTHPHGYVPPTSPDTALAAVQSLLSLPHVRTLTETADHLRLLSTLIAPGVIGPKMHEARVAAICLGHGITELWTVDRDYSYFPALRTHNPLA